MSEIEIKSLKKEIKRGVDAANVKTLRILHQILEIENEEDWWDDLPLEVQKSIEAGIKQADNGEVISHEESMKRNKKWFKG